MTKSRELIRRAKFLFDKSIIMKLIVGSLKDKDAIEVCRAHLVCLKSGNADAGLLMQEIVWRYLLLGDAGVCCLVMLAQGLLARAGAGLYVLLLGGAEIVAASACWKRYCRFLMQSGRLCRHCLVVSARGGCERRDQSWSSEDFLK